MKEYTGVIIEESLKNNKVLKDIKIIKTDIERITKEHETPWLKQWTLHMVTIPEDKAKEIAKKISKSFDKEHDWYADFKNDTMHYIIFKNKVFHIKRTKEEYKKVKAYGISAGIADYQLDFSPQAK
jgi:hypothetical protein